MITEIERQSIIMKLDGMLAELDEMKEKHNKLLLNNRNVSNNLDSIEKILFPLDDKYSDVGTPMIAQPQNRSLNSRKPVTYKAKRKIFKTPIDTPDVKSAVRLDVRLVEEPTFPYRREKFDSPGTVFAFARTLHDRDVEQLIILHLNNANILNCLQVFPGTINKVNCYIREIIKDSILSASTAIILTHNHPSGQLVFSPEDKRFTSEVKFAASLMGVKVHDHILIAGDRYKSLEDDELI
ncbi:MAG: DNA repair protein RadC [Syntrophaceae bacterium]|nr:MAG: DNA repair protein RadC [Syntrophaceae bacterium]